MHYYTTHCKSLHTACGQNSTNEPNLWKKPQDLELDVTVLL